MADLYSVMLPECQFQDCAIFDYAGSAVLSLVGIGINQSDVALILVTTYVVLFQRWRVFLPPKKTVWNLHAF